MTANGEAERASERLRRAAEPDWSAAVAHRFVQELADGTIDRAVLRRYLVQDYQFIDAFVVLLGAAIQAAPGFEQRVALGRFLGLVTSAENTYFERSFDELGVPGTERVRPALAAPTAGFRELMHEAAASGDYGSMVAVLTVAEWLYLAWAAPLAGRAPDWFVIREWVALHSGPDFEAWVEFLRTELDRAVEAGDAAARERIAARFHRAVALERAFFDAAYAA